MKKSTKRIISTALSAMMLMGCVSTGFSVSASTGELCSKYATNPNGQVGKEKTITVDGDASDWSEDMLIAQGAAWDVANHYKGGHENCVLDTYSLYATWDNDNLYVGWQMVNTTDTWAREGDGPLSDGGRVLDVPLILALSVDPNSTSMSNKNTSGNPIWGQKMGLEFNQHVDHLFYMSGKPGLGTPAMFTAVDDEGNTDYTTGCKPFASSGIEYKMATTNICSSIWGLNYSEDTSDVYDDSADWVDYKTFEGSSGTHNTKYDSFYEMKIPFSALGIDKTYLEKNGVGAMLVATRGESGLDCIPYDDTMLDNATGSYSSDPSTSAEKDDVDVITSKFARIGNMGGDEPITRPTTQPTTAEPTTVQPTTSAATTVAPTTAQPATDLTVKATSNLFPEKEVTVDKNAKTVTVNCDLKSTMKLVNGYVEISYDPNVLSFDPAKNTDILPFISDETTNPQEGIIRTIFSDVNDLYDFTTNKSFLNLVFDVVSTGSTTVDIYVDELSVGYHSNNTLNFKNAYTGGKAIDLSSVAGFTTSKLTGTTTIFADQAPTTAPATTAPATTQPSTTQPATDATQPTTTPSGDGATIKFAAPTSYASRYNWSKPVLFYGNTQSVDKSTQLSMTATSEKYYTTEVGSSTLLTTNGWTVYELKISKDQAAAINSSKFVGFATADGVNRTTLVSGSNVLKAGVDTYTAKYGTTANTVAALDGKTFVIRDSAYGATSSTSFVGYWVSDFVTVRAAAPLAATAYSTWDNVDLYYGNTTAFDSMTKLSMINTGDTTKVSSLNGNMTIKTGRWYIYAITLDKATASAVESAKYVGFNKTDAVNRTSILKNVLFAKTNTFDGNYNSKARTLSELDGQLFVIKGMTSTSSSVATYTGEWETKDVYTQGKDDTVTLYFAAPKGVKDYANWDTGVQLYYSNDNVYTNAERIDMKKVNETKKVTVDSSKLKTLKSGNWDVYSVTLTVDQIKAIDNCQSVGFVKKGSFNRTSYTAYRNICKASKMDGDSTYSGVRESIETFDGYMFVINSCYTPSNENISLTGSWVVK